MKTVVIIQARMGSTRLPGKVMKPLKNRAVLEHDILRIKQCQEVNQIVIATTQNEQDNVIVDCAQKMKVGFFRGDEADVLGRYYGAAEKYEADIIVRITSDCPLIDPKLVDKVIRYFKQNKYTYVHLVNHPRGMDTEVFSFEGLKEAKEQAKESYQREHVTPYLYQEGKKIGKYKLEGDYSKYRLTLDTEEDWAFIQKVYEKLYHGAHDFYLEEIIELLELYPELCDINKDVQQKTIQ